MTKVDWASGSWLNPPPEFRVIDGELEVVSGKETDFWNHTGYEFTHDNGHALLHPFPPHSAMEVEFSADWAAQFDQAGMLMHADPEHWIKAGVEFADGVLGVGAVVTAENSDWSVGHVPEWGGKQIWVRVSRTENAVTIRARIDGEPWRLVRLAPIDSRLDWHAGPTVASPSRAGLVVRFRTWQTSQPESALHD